MLSRLSGSAPVFEHGGDLGELDDVGPVLEDPVSAGTLGG